MNKNRTTVDIKAVYIPNASRGKNSNPAYRKRFGSRHPRLSWAQRKAIANGWDLQ